ncbi:hypothetical protein [Brevibacillus marinus]|uniref:hypothetical protein n=1 Tax=Brevibacillus marinus TaxID=2496837 RepID=UPI000F8326A3|nr:hypothetical protein [Brevibacillus marinus]
MWKWILLLALALSGLSAPPAAAADSVGISVDIPVNGQVKFQQWTRVQVTLTNNGAPFAGSVTIYQTHIGGGNQRDTGISQQVSLAEGESKPYAFDLSGEMLNNYSLVVKVFDDAGREVASQPIITAGQPSEGAVVAVIADDPNAFHFLAMNNERSARTDLPSFTVLHLTPEDIPEQSWVLKNVDILAVSGSAAGSLRDGQLEAIEEWVRRGGVLLLSAGPGQEETVRPFAELYSLPSAAPGETAQLDQLREIAGDDPLPLAAIPVYHRELPLVSAKQAGAGLLLFANYDVTAEPLASWQYNREWWQHLLHKYGALERVEKNSRDLFNHSNSLLSKMIPGVEPPDARLLFVLWLLYVLVVAPVLYIVLKRIDRREWAWGIIPGLAVLFSIGVFTIGRAQVADGNTSFTVSQIEIIDERLAEVSAAGSFLHIAGGSYTVEAAPGFVVSPFWRSAGELSEIKASIARDADGKTRITLERVPYLTIRQIAAAGVRQDVGAFAADLTVEQNRLQGTIANNTAFDAEELYVQLGMQRIALGPLKKGEAKTVDEKIEAFITDSHDDALAYGSRLTREERIERMRQELLDEHRTDNLRLIATTTQPLALFAMQEESEDHHYNVLSQNIRLAPNEDGRIVYPYGTLPVRMVEDKGEFINVTPSAYEVAGGSVTFALAVGEADFTVKRLEVPLDLSPFRPFDKEIYHAASDTWQPLAREQRVVLEEQQLEEYVNRDGSLLIRFRNPSAQPLTLPKPLFQVEGEVSQP